MKALGEEIYRVSDEQGWIRVHQDHSRRYLTFGNDVEQSCMLLADPMRLEHVHTQAMMLGALFTNPVQRVSLLGLGGGSLAKALLQGCPRSRIYAIELRPQVVTIAHEFFALPQAPGLRVLVTDALSYLQNLRKPQDLIFADLYQADAMDRQQADPRLLDTCRAKLRPGGLLVLNLWHHDPKYTAKVEAMVAERFEQRLLGLTVQSGNRILYAFADRLPLSGRNGLFDQARRMGAELNIPLIRLARALWFENAATFRFGNQLHG